MRVPLRFCIAPRGHCVISFAPASRSLVWPARRGRPGPIGGGLLGHGSGRAVVGCPAGGARGGRGGAVRRRPGLDRLECGRDAKRQCDAGQYIRRRQPALWRPRDRWRGRGGRHEVAAGHVDRGVTEQLPAALCDQRRSDGWGRVDTRTRVARRACARHGDDGGLAVPRRRSHRIALTSSFRRSYSLLTPATRPQDPIVW